jgi:uncharacterized protein (UPF0548 family)
VQADVMTEWRFLRGWTDAELEARLARTRQLSRNFADDPDALSVGGGWGRHASEALVAREAPGPPLPDGPFARAWPLVAGYQFSDPRIVRGHFDPAVPLLGRRMLLEARVLGLHYLGPVLVGAERADDSAGYTVRGFRYDTLFGHFERGVEWFLLKKQHVSGHVTFRIQAAWQEGDFPNAWSRIGFRLVGQRYQRAWHRLAHLRLRRMLGSADLPPLPRGRRLVHGGPDLDVSAIRPLTAATPHADGIAEREVPEPRRG